MWVLSWKERGHDWRCRSGEASVQDAKWVVQVTCAVISGDCSAGLETRAVSQATSISMGAVTLQKQAT